VGNIRTNQAVFDVASQPLSSRCALDASCSPPDDACMSPQLLHASRILTDATGRVAIRDHLRPISPLTLPRHSSASR
jgi:hypothetical protein